MDAASEARHSEMLDQILVMVTKMTADLEATNAAFRAAFPPFTTDGISTTSSKPATTSSASLVPSPTSAPSEDATSTVFITFPEDAATLHAKCSTSGPNQGVQVPGSVLTSSASLIPSQTSAPQQDAALDFQFGITKLLVTSPTRCSTSGPCDSVRAPVSATMFMASAAACLASTPPHDVAASIQVTWSKHLHIMHAMCSVLRSNFHISADQAMTASQLSINPAPSVDMVQLGADIKAGDTHLLFAVISDVASTFSLGDCKPMDMCRHGLLGSTIHIQVSKAPKPPWLLCTALFSSWSDKLQLISGFLLEASPWCRDLTVWVQENSPFSLVLLCDTCNLEADVVHSNSGSYILVFEGLQVNPVVLFQPCHDAILFDSETCYLLSYGWIITPFKDHGKRIKSELLAVFLSYFGCSTSVLDLMSLRPLSQSKLMQFQLDACVLGCAVCKCTVRFPKCEISLDYMEHWFELFSRKQVNSCNIGEIVTRSESNLNCLAFDSYKLIIWVLSMQCREHGVLLQLRNWPLHVLSQTLDMVLDNKMILLHCEIDSECWKSWIELTGNAVHVHMHDILSPWCSYYVVLVKWNVFGSPLMQPKMFPRSDADKWTLLWFFFCCCEDKEKCSNFLLLTSGTVLSCSEQSIGSVIPENHIFLDMMRSSTLALKETWHNHCSSTKFILLECISAAVEKILQIYAAMQWRASVQTILNMEYMQVPWDPGICEVLQSSNIATHGLGASRVSRREVCHDTTQYVADWAK